MTFVEPVLKILRLYHECEAFRVMANGGRKGRIFLAHPHTNKIFLFLALFCIF